MVFFIYSPMFSVNFGSHVCVTPHSHSRIFFPFHFLPILGLKTKFPVLSAALTLGIAWLDCCSGNNRVHNLRDFQPQDEVVFYVTSVSFPTPHLGNTGSVCGSLLLFVAPLCIPALQSRVWRDAADQVTQIPAELSVACGWHLICCFPGVCLSARSLRLQATVECSWCLKQHAENGNCWLEKLQLNAHMRRN